MGKNRGKKTLGQSAPVPAQRMSRNELPEDQQKLMNNLINVLGLDSATGLGGGVNPIGYPFNQGMPGTATVENVGTIFKNLRWYMISNMRQVLNQAYVEFGLVQTICDVPVDDALRGGVTVKSQQLDEDQIQELMAAVDRDDDLNIAGQAAKWNRLFGGAGILILTDQDPETEFDPEDLSEDDPLEFRAVDMWELFWDKQNTEGWSPLIEPEDFEYYNYYGEQVHKSRVIRLKGMEAPSFIRPKLRGWGFSVVEILVRSINQYLKGTDLAFEVMDEFKVDIYKVKNFVQALASPQGEQLIKKRLQIANWQKNYQNALTMDSEDDWDHKQLSFSGLAEIMMQIRMQVAADMRMPLTKLFGISAAGFNSGEDDIEVYNAMVESQVRNKIKYPILRILEIKCQQLFGFIPDDLSVTFEPLRIMSSLDEQTVKTGKVNNALAMLAAGAISLKEFRDEVNKAELLEITLEESETDLLEGYMDDTVTDETDGEPGSERPTSQRSTAGGKTPKNGDPKQPPKAKPSKNPDTPEAKVKNSLIVMPKPYTRRQLMARRIRNSATFDRKSYEAEGGDLWIDARRSHFFDRDKASDKALWDRAVAASSASLGKESWQFIVWFYKKNGGRFGQLSNSKKFDESKIKRDDDGQFSTTGGGGGAGKPDSGALAKLKAKYPYLSHTDVSASDLDRKAAIAEAKRLRAEGVYATVWHMDGPKTGPKSKYTVAVPSKDAPSNVPKEDESPKEKKSSKPPKFSVKSKIPGEPLTSVKTGQMVVGAKSGDLGEITGKTVALSGGKEAIVVKIEQTKPNGETYTGLAHYVKSAKGYYVRKLGYNGALGVDYLIPSEGVTEKQRKDQDDAVNKAAIDRDEWQRAEATRLHEERQRNK